MIRNLPHIFDNSPIEFILVGPFEGRDKILAQSKSPGLDLFGILNHRSMSTSKTYNDRSLFGIFSKKVRNLNFVQSKKEFDLHQHIDDRYSRYWFIWVGGASSSEKKQLEYNFSDSIPSISFALQEDDRASLSMLIGGLVLQCTEFDKKLQRRKDSLTIILFIYILVIIVVTVLIVNGTFPFFKQ